MEVYIAPRERSAGGAWLQFQETDAGLVFATLEQSTFDTSELPDRICAVLENLGWEVDQDNVG